MEFLRLFNVFEKKRDAPERVPTDTVIPLFTIDQHVGYRKIAFEYTMLFEEVLDADKLSGALWKLLEKPGWRKLGARLRLNGKDKLEFHVPAQYTPKRSPIQYRQSTESMSVWQHPYGRHILRPNGKIQVTEDFTTFRTLMGTQENEVLIDDWLYSDKPQISLHIINFEDATFVTLTWLHTLLDAMGRKLLLSAWQAVLEGRDEDVPEFIGYSTDPVKDLGRRNDSASTMEHTQPHEENILKPLHVKSFGLFRFVFNYMWELFFYPKETGRMLLLPSLYFQKIKAKAIEDLETLDPKHVTDDTSGTKPGPFISDGDILAAWFMRLMASVNGGIISSPPSRTLCAIVMFGMRDLLRNTSPPLLPPTGAYIHNCVTPIWSYFTIHEFLTAPLGHVAARIRKALVQQTTRPQIEAGRRTINEEGDLLYGTPDMAITNMTNWTKARLYDIDFSAAVVGGAKDAMKPTFLNVYMHRAKGYAIRGATIAMGIDGNGDWWLWGLMRENDAAAFNAAVEKVNREMDP